MRTGVHQAQPDARSPAPIDAPSLFISARTIADSLQHGRHPSTRRGASTEFYDFRPYVPGDPVRLVDWRALARSDRAYLRRFHHEGQLSVTIVLDASASMRFTSLRAPVGSTPPSKFRRAQELAATIAMVVIRQGDRAGLIVSGSGERPCLVVPPGAGQASLRQVIEAVAQAQPESARPAVPGRELLDAISLASAQAARGGLVVVITDALDEPGPILDALSRVKYARGRNRDVALLQVLAPDELDISGVGSARLVDPESGLGVSARGERCGDSYAASIQRHIETLRSGVGRLNGRFGLCMTHQSPVDALHRALAP